LYNLSPDYANHYDCASSIIYMLCSTSTSLWYIGETQLSLIDRIKAHVRSIYSIQDAKSNEDEDYSHQKLYRIWNRIGLMDFVAFPLEINNHDTTERRKQREKKLIRTYKPSLNSTYLSNPFISVRHNSRKTRRPFMYQRHHDNKKNIVHKKQAYYNITSTLTTNIPLFAKYVYRAYEEYNIQCILQRCYPGIIIAVMRIGGLNDFTYISGLKRHFKECKII
jgi:hypothetical protein